ncbi:hypothetical protein A7A48_01680 [Acinetobacter baumannii]|nr:hypothetical protein A7A48_01680 [Acinetobacter baumannii]
MNWIAFYLLLNTFAFASLDSLRSFNVFSSKEISLKSDQAKKKLKIEVSPTESIRAKRCLAESKPNKLSIYILKTRIIKSIATYKDRQ